ncbi:unnamed protein product, partial [marine sediment metagenome]
PFEKGGPCGHIRIFCKEKCQIDFYDDSQLGGGDDGPPTLGSKGGRGWAFFKQLHMHETSPFFADVSNNPFGG